MTPEREAQMRELFVQWMKTCEGYPFAGAFANLMWDSWLACARALEPKWVDAADQDPPDAEPVLVSGFAYNNPKYARTYGVAFYAEGVWVSDETGERIHTPTHWMPLPEQPKAAMSAATVAEPSKPCQYPNCGCDSRAKCKSLFTGAPQQAELVGGEQSGFETWAKSERYDMSQHPLHYLFLNERTYAARQGWKAAIKFAAQSGQRAGVAEVVLDYLKAHAVPSYQVKVTTNPESASLCQQQIVTVDCGSWGNLIEHIQRAAAPTQQQERRE